MGINYTILRSYCVGLLGLVGKYHGQHTDGRTMFSGFLVVKIWKKKRAGSLKVLWSNLRVSKACRLCGLTGKWNSAGLMGRVCHWPLLLWSLAQDRGSLLESAGHRVERWCQVMLTWILRVAMGPTTFCFLLAVSHTNHTSFAIPGSIRIWFLLAWETGIGRPGATSNHRGTALQTATRWRLVVISWCKTWEDGDQFGQWQLLGGTVLFLDIDLDRSTQVTQTLQR